MCDLQRGVRGDQLVQNRRDGEPYIVIFFATYLRISFVFWGSGCMMAASETQ
jgi:hypothetical protein